LKADIIYRLNDLMPIDDVFQMVLDLKNFTLRLKELNDSQRLIATIVFVLIYLTWNWFFLGLLWTVRLFFTSIKVLVLAFLSLIDWITYGYFNLLRFVLMLPVQVLLFFPQIIFELWTRYTLNGHLVPLSLPQAPEELSMMEMLRQILIAVRSARTQESMQHGSTFIPVDLWPKHLISIMDPQGRHRGFGSFVQGPNGKSLLITAKHVMKSMREGCVLMGPSQKPLKLTEHKHWFSTTFDLCGILVEPKIASQLGAIKLTLASTPGTGTAVSTYGYQNGKLVRSIGIVENADSNLKFKHTCSTLGGFSGTPIIKGDKNLVGIHLETCTLGYNYGLSLDFLQRKKEESPGGGQRDRRLFGQFEDRLDTGDDDYLYFDGDDEGYHYKSQGHTYSEETYAIEETQRQKMEDSYRTAANKGTWANDDDDDEDYFKRPPRFQEENSDFRNRTEAPLKPQSSAPITGQLAAATAATTTTTQEMILSPQLVVTPASTSDPVVPTNGPREDSRGNTANRRQRKGKSTQLSTTGTGPTAPPKTPSSPSTSTLPASPKETESPPVPKKKKSSALSKARKRILELESRIASQSKALTCLAETTS
jgi:hypothetical protein